MKKINIRIPDNLSPAREAIEISKRIFNTGLLGNGSIKKIGNSVDVWDNQTTITITRVPTTPITKTTECSVCKAIFDNPTGKCLYVNYGGKRKKRIYCSDVCRDFVYSICGNQRVSKTKTYLKSKK
jgi:hypothetical protein